jgi:hypothetical protein
MSSSFTCSSQSLPRIDHHYRQNHPGDQSRSSPYHNRWERFPRRDPRHFNGELIVNRTVRQIRSGGNFVEIAINGSFRLLSLNGSCVSILSLCSDVSLCFSSKLRLLNVLTSLLRLSASSHARGSAVDCDLGRNSPQNSSQEPLSPHAISPGARCDSPYLLYMR